MDTNIVICVLIGLPGAGKTTLAQEMKHFESFKTMRVILLSFDDFLSLNDQQKIVVESRNQVDQNIFKASRSEFLEKVKNLISSIKCCQITETAYPYLKDVDLKENHKFLIILDDNFYYKSMRYKVFQIASELNCGFCQVFLDCCENLAKKRNGKRLMKVPNEVIHTMKERLESPCLSNSWESMSLTIQSACVRSNIEELQSFVLNSFNNGLLSQQDNFHEKEKAQAVNFRNVIHRADIILRFLVGERIKDIKKEGASKSISASQMKNVFVEVNAIRQEILADLKVKNLTVPDHIFDEKGTIMEENLREFLERKFDASFAR